MSDQEDYSDDAPGESVQPGELPEEITREKLSQPIDDDGLISDLSEPVHLEAAISNANARLDRIEDNLFNDADAPAETTPATSDDVGTEQGQCKQMQTDLVAGWQQFELS